MSKLGNSVGAEVGHGVAFHPRPDVLHGVELGGVGWQELEREPTASAVDQALDGNGLVRSDVVPDHDDPATDVAKQVPEKYENLRSSDRPRTHQDVQLALRADARDRRELRPAIAVSDDRRLPLRRPGPDARGDQAEAALISEDQRGFQSAGFFLMRRQSSRTQRCTSASFRSMARPVGR